MNTALQVFLQRMYASLLEAARNEGRVVFSEGPFTQK